MKFFFIIFPIISFAADFSKNDFENAMNLIKSESVHKFTDDELYKAALSGILEHINSEQTNKKSKPFFIKANSLLNSKKLHSLKEDLNGEVSGVGVGIRFDPEKGDTYPVVIKVYDGGGAKLAGIAKGDQILKINNEPTTRASSFENIVYRIRGPVGSSVKLSLLREGEVLTKNVKRKKISFETTSFKVLSKGTGYLKIDFFNKKTPEEVRDKLKIAKNKMLKNMIIDLRGNSGGALAEGKETLKLFFEKGAVLFKTQVGDKVEQVTASQNGPGSDFKFAVLVSSVTRSMAEAFAYSLKGQKSAVLIGEKTFGKASIENLFELGNGYSAKISIGKLMGADGKSWQNSGVAPNIVVPVGNKQPEFDSALIIAQKLFTL